MERDSSERLSCRKSDIAGGMAILSDFADQPMLLVGPRRERGIAKQPVEFPFRNIVAFAGAVPQTVVIEDRDVAAPITDKPRFLKGPHDIGDRGSPYSQHHPQE